MTLETLQKEMIIAMKHRDKIRKDALSSMVSAVKKAGIDKGCRDNIPESLVDEVLLKEQKTVQEMIDTCPATREDLLNEYTAKKAVIDIYAPKLLTETSDIETFIDSLGIEVTKANRGALMKALKGKVDMKVANKIISQRL